MAHSFWWSTALKASSADVEGKTVGHPARCSTVFAVDTALEAFSAVLHKNCGPSGEVLHSFFGKVSTETVDHCSPCRGKLWTTPHLARKTANRKILEQNCEALASPPPKNCGALRYSKLWTPP